MEFLPKFHKAESTIMVNGYTNKNQYLINGNIVWFYVFIRVRPLNICFMVSTTCSIFLCPVFCSFLEVLLLRQALME